MKRKKYWKRWYGPRLCPKCLAEEECREERLRIELRLYALALLVLLCIVVWLALR